MATATKDTVLNQEKALPGFITEMVESAINENWTREEDPAKWDACRHAMEKILRELGPADTWDAWDQETAWIAEYPGPFGDGFNAGRGLRTSEDPAAVPGDAYDGCLGRAVRIP